MLVILMPNCAMIDGKNPVVCSIGKILIVNINRISLLFICTCFFSEQFIVYQLVFLFYYIKYMEFYLLHNPLSVRLMIFFICIFPKIPCIK